MSLNPESPCRVTSVQVPGLGPTARRDVDLAPKDPPHAKPDQSGKSEPHADTEQQLRHHV